ncbi:MAG: type II secretion system F family protein [Ruminiclostridium sp.]|nr:type II secretion system F family protein [Ruminiclostridium sp.]
MAKLKRLNYEQTAFFFEQLWLMINTGMQLDDGLEILAEDMDDECLSDVCTFLAGKTSEGKSLAEGIAESGVFPRYAEKMTEIGCMTGKLDEILKGLSEYYENRAETEQAVRYAVFHPCMLLVMMTVVMIVLVVKIIPMFSDIFSGFDAGIGSAVEDIVGIAYTAGQAVLIALIVLIVLLAVIVLIPPVKRAVLRFASVFPLTRGISRTLAQAKLADAMRIMITGGIDPEEALEHSAGLITDKKLSAQLKSCLEMVRGGEYFSDAVCKSGILPKIYARSLKIAYTSGSFEAVWQKISRRSNEEAQRTVANLLSLVEPAIVLLLAVMIGSVLLTIMIPLMNIMSALG